MPRLTIAVDCDDVLAGYAEAFVNFSNHHFGGALTVDDYQEDWATVWSVDYDEVKRRTEEMFRLKMLANLKHDPQALPVLQKLKERFDLVVLTSRRRESAEMTKLWIDQHYPGIFNSINFAGIWDEITPGSHLKTKGDACRLLKADYLIDDQPKHCLAANDCGVKAVLFGDYPWQRNAQLPQGIVKAPNWQVIADHFKCVAEQVSLSGEAG